MNVDLEALRRRLQAEQQDHLLQFWDRLDDAQRQGLLEQIARLDLEVVRRMRELLRQASKGVDPGRFEPAPVEDPDEATRAEARIRGEAALQAGEVGALMVAGGQGSRLGVEGPKALFPIGPISRATLLEIHTRTVRAIGRRYGRPVPFYIMTSPENHEAIRTFLEEHGGLGLAPDQVYLFPQAMWPALCPDGRIVMDRPDHIFLSPDGHGGVLAALRRHGLFEVMRRQGVRTLFYFQVDNPLVKIADPVFVGLHQLRRADVSLKVCAKRDPEEGLGVVVRDGSRHRVVEYTELTREQKHERDADGGLRFRYGSVAIHVFDVPFLEREAQRDLPLHLAHKKVPYCDAAGLPRRPTEPNAYKFEKFIFDVLPYAERVMLLAFPREEEFSPVKNATGLDSPETARRDLVRRAARWLEAAGVRVPRHANGEPLVALEIEPALALTAEELRQRLLTPWDVSGDLLLWEGDPRFRK